MNKPDWSNAPENAEVWIEDLHPEIGWDESRFCYSRGGDWKDCGSDGFWAKSSERSGEIKVHYRPKQTERRGSEDGLPPVGTVCEVSNCGQPFVWCRVRFMGNNLCVVDLKTHLEQHFHLSSVVFRPIKSDREKWIDEAVVALGAHGSWRRAIGKLYDAGLAKLPEQGQ